VKGRLFYEGDSKDGAGGAFEDEGVAGGGGAVGRAARADEAGLNGFAADEHEGEVGLAQDGEVETRGAGKLGGPEGVVDEGVSNGCEKGVLPIARVGRGRAGVGLPGWRR
jgi:hypothetical protein